MSRPAGRALWMALVLALATAPAPARAQAPPPDPFAPTWTNLVGARVFGEKGCGLCHAIRGVGATAAPDLSRIAQKSFFDLGAAMSNHLRGVAIKKPTLTPDDVASLIAFLFTLQYHDQPGDPKVGETLFAQKGCVVCHEVGGRGGRIGPSLDFLKRADSPVLVAAALWNHGPSMDETLKAQGIPRPTFSGKELGDIIAYIVTAARDGDVGRARVTAGSPESGRRLFVSRQCVMCHAIGGKGGNIGPELGRRHHVSLTQFAATMWNHAPGMTAQMQARGVQVPRLTGQEMADLVAHLYVSHYFDQEVSATRGRAVLEAKGCLGCHALGGKGGTSASDLASYRAIRSSPGLVAAMWNHPRYLEKERREVAWPQVSGQELADVAAHLAALPAPAAPKSKTP
jgi:cytochrome c551/c552